MNNRIACALAALAVAGSTLALAAPALAGGSDAFDRPNLGPGWLVTNGTLAISGDQLVGSTEAIGTLNASRFDTAASAVVFLGGTDLEYGAVAVGNIAGGANAFVKIQQQNGAGFDHAAFYTGNNGTGDFFALSSPVPSPAILDVTFCGTTAYMRITSAAGVQTYSYNYGESFGAGGGLGTYGAVHLDNYIGFKTNCSAAQVAGAVAASDMRRDPDLSRAK